MALCCAESGVRVKVWIDQSCLAHGHTHMHIYNRMTLFLALLAGSTWSELSRQLEHHLAADRHLESKCKLGTSTLNSCVSCCLLMFPGGKETSESCRTRVYSLRCSVAPVEHLERLHRFCKTSMPACYLDWLSLGSHKQVLATCISTAKFCKLGC